MSIISPKCSYDVTFMEDKMWSKAWRLVNEAINVIKNDKERFNW